MLKERHTSEKESISMIRTGSVIALSALLLAYGGLVSAQQAVQSRDAQTSTLRAVSTPTIPVLSTANARSSGQARSPERLRHKSRAITAAPAPLDAAQYAGLTGKSMPVPDPVMDLQAGEKPHLEHLRLTARHNYSGYGWLDLNEIRHIDAKDDYALFYTATDPVMAWTRAHLKVEAGERYLLDFSVGVSVETTFHIGVSGGSQKSTVEKGSHHLLVYLDADKTKTTQVSLTSDNADYTFYALDVTRVE